MHRSVLLYHRMYQYTHVEREREKKIQEFFRIHSQFQIFNFAKFKLSNLLYTCK